MGVRHLLSFMERKVHGGTYTVRMDKEIVKAKKNGKSALIVLDLMALYGMLNADKRSLLCGSQIRLAEQKAADFFSSLTDVGAELVFFYDGSLLATKYDTWIKRQSYKYENMIEIMDAIDRRVPLAKVAERYQTNIPNNTDINLKRVAKQHGKVIVSMHVECDQALAAYATEHNALAVLSHDTDFMIFPGEWQLWSADHINRQTLATRGYNRQALLRLLGLRWDEIGVWASLAGNDFFNYDELEPFLNNLGPHSQKFYRLAEYVRSLPVKKGLDESTVHSILRRVYKNRSMPLEAIEWFKHSVNFYKIDKQSYNANPPMDTLKEFLLQSDQQFVYNILTGVPHKCTLLFFDYRTNEFGNYCEIITPIISRNGGIILFHNQHERQHVKVLMKRNHEETHNFSDVAVTFPTELTPPHVLELLSPEPSIREALLERKLQLLSWICSDDLLLPDLAQKFFALPSSLMLTVVVLYRLRQYGVIRMFEADLLLLIAHQVATGEFDPANEPLPFRLVARAFRLGFLFQKVYVHFARAARSIGLPREYRPSVPYDGHRFHNLYTVWSTRRVLEDHLTSITDWRLYRHARQ
uniref:Constitutive coactivator of peroxisome proliferator-activated receptor gamma n=1 Tax=Anopheles farauti TaxID=69004 RepID=A0A182R0P8_9DIPT